VNRFDRPGGRQGLPVAFLFGLLLAGAAHSASSPLRTAGVPAVADCERRFAADPEAEASSSCFYEAGKEPSQQAEAIRRAEGLLRLHPGNPWLTYFLGSLLWADTGRSSDLSAAAADLMAARGLALGEVRACWNLYLQLHKQGRQKEEAAVVSRAVRVAEASDDPLAIARARILESTDLINRSQDLPRSYRLVLEARKILFAKGSAPLGAESTLVYTLRRDCLLNMASLAVNLGRLNEAHDLAQTEVDLTARRGDHYAEAFARAHLLRVVREELYLLPTPDARRKVLEQARQTLAVAEAARHPSAQIFAHQILGLLTDDAESEIHFQRCRDLAVLPRDQSVCRSMEARRSTADPHDSLRLLDEALDLAKQARSPDAIANVWRERMRVSWRLAPPEQALQESITALEAIELVRDLQAPTEGRAEVFTLWASHYHWLAGRLLQNAGAADPRAHNVADIAFGIQERMRARALIESLTAANARPSTATQTPDFASLDQVRQALAPDEALLSFQIAPWQDMVGDFAGGAWLMVVTRNGAAVHALHAPLAERTRLRPTVEVFSGLFTGNGDDGDTAAALYRALLADGLSDLDPGIQRLVIVPDDVLHLLPFAALRPAPEAPPLATRYEITLTPSATLWLEWRQSTQAASGTAALVLADPASRSAVVPASIRSAAPGLGPLPWAQVEGKAVLRHLGAGSRLLLGADATEAYLKSGPVPYGILHFATHAWTSDNEPESSFVLLAPGAPGEDGRLHPNEIVKLKLRGRIVVLSACSSASGEILRGEGVMNLARAFFQAGAHTVVATLWPLRDDHGAALFDRFYAHLGEGLSVAAALHAAQQDRMADGAPPAAWAGVIVLGDGDRVPVPGGRPGLPRFAFPAALALSGLSLAVFLARRRRVRA
jgi:CHAT domain-containing protein